MGFIGDVKCFGLEGCYRVRLKEVILLRGQHKFSQYQGNNVDFRLVHE